MVKDGFISVQYDRISCQPKNAAGRVTVHGTSKLENSPAGRDWKFGPHAFVPRSLRTQTEEKVIEELFARFFASNFGRSSPIFVPFIKVASDHI